MAGKEPIGATFRQFGLTIEIVGVAADTKALRLDGGSEPVIYELFDQAPAGWMTVLVRARQRAASIAADVRSAVAEIDASLAIAELSLMEDVVASSVANPQLLTIVVGGFSLAAALLAAVGVYGLSAHWTRERRNELAVRLALGAQPHRLVYFVLTRAARAILIGVVAGLLLALAAERALRAALAWVVETQPETYVGVTTVLVLVALFASWLRARHAAAIDPMDALRGP